jgi:hypothetical protein
MEALLVSLLAPCLPYLLQAGKGLADKASEAIGAKVWESGQALWERLAARVGERPAAAEAVADVAADPDDEPARGALQLQLRKILESDSALRAQVEAILSHAHQQGVVIHGDVRADRGGIAAGRDVNAGTINAGYRPDVRDA